MTKAKGDKTRLVNPSEHFVWHYWQSRSSNHIIIHSFKVSVTPLQIWSQEVWYRGLKWYDLTKHITENIILVWRPNHQLALKSLYNSYKCDTEQHLKFLQYVWLLSFAQQFYLDWDEFIVIMLFVCLVGSFNFNHADTPSS